MSNPLLDIVTSSLDQRTLSQIAAQLGASPEVVARAAGAAVPALVGALNNQAATPQGAASLASALDRDHDGSILDDLGGLLGAGGGGLGGLLGGSGGLGGLLGGAGGLGKALDGAGILGHILGGKRAGVESKIGQASGLDAGMVGKLLELLAPIVMAALARAKSSGGGSLTDILGGATAQSNAGLGGMLGSLLDQDGDGDPTDDIARLGTSLLGGLFGKK